MTECYTYFNTIELTEAIELLITLSKYLGAILVGVILLKIAEKLMKSDN